MWKKEGFDSSIPEPVSSGSMSTGYDRPAPRSSGERATIGPSITIHGEVKGDEDLLIQGRVDGSVKLEQHAVTVGPEGEVKADIAGRTVIVEGKVEGNIKADEQVILRSTARVLGDITAPRVVLEDGARFRGGVDMGEPLERASRASSSSSSRASASSKTSETTTNGSKVELGAVAAS